MFFTRACGMGLVSSLQNTMPSARKSSAYLAAPVTLATTSCGMKSLPMCLKLLTRHPRFSGGTHDAVEIVVVGAAATQIARHRQARLVTRGLGIVFEQRDRRHHLPGRAEPTLRRELGDERLLHRVQLAIGAGQALDGHHLARAHRVRERRTGDMADIVDEHGAGAAFAPVAPKFGAGESELVTQGHRQRLVRQHVDAPHLAIDVQRNQALHAAGRAALAAAARQSAVQIGGGRDGGSRGNDPLDELAPRKPSCTLGVRRLRLARSCWLPFIRTRGANEYSRGGEMVGIRQPPISHPRTRVERPERHHFPASRVDPRGWG